MADFELARRTSEAMVSSLAPDMCWTADGALVPYSITMCLDQAVRTVSSVLACGMPVCNDASRLMTVVGNEAGTGGGVVSGVNLGHCRPLTCCPTVLAGGRPVSYHTDRYGMNCAGPDGPYNTVGRLVHGRPGSEEHAIAPDGTILGGSTNPPVVPETADEAAQMARIQPPPGSMALRATGVQGTTAVAPAPAPACQEPAGLAGRAVQTAASYVSPVGEGLAQLGDHVLQTTVVGPIETVLWAGSFIARDAYAHAFDDQAMLGQIAAEQAPANAAAQQVLDDPGGAATRFFTGRIAHIQHLRDQGNTQATVVETAKYIFDLSVPIYGGWQVGRGVARGLRPGEVTPGAGAPVGGLPGTSPVDDLPVGTAPVDDLPVGAAPVDGLPGTSPVDDLPVGTAPVDDVPVGTAPDGGPAATGTGGTAPARNTAPLTPAQQQQAAWAAQRQAQQDALRVPQGSRKVPQPQQLAQADAGAPAPGVKVTFAKIELTVKEAFGGTIQVFDAGGTRLGYVVDYTENSLSLWINVTKYGKGQGVGQQVFDRLLDEALARNPRIRGVNGEWNLKQPGMQDNLNVFNRAIEEGLANRGLGPLTQETRIPDEVLLEAARSTPTGRMAARRGYSTGYLDRFQRDLSGQFVDVEFHFRRPAIPAAPRPPSP